MDGNLLQKIVFLSFPSIFRIKGGFPRHKGSMEDACMFKGQIGKTTPQTLDRLGNFPILALFFHLSLSKIWLTHPHKNYIFLKLSRMGPSFHKVWLS